MSANMSTPCRVRQRPSILITAYPSQHIKAQRCIRPCPAVQCALAPPYGWYKKPIVFARAMLTTSRLIDRFGVKRVVVGDRVNYRGPQETLEQAGIEVVVLDTEECIDLTKQLIEKSPEKWYGLIQDK